MKKLFLSFFKIGAFTFGGGYAMIPLIEDEIVKKEKLLNQQEFEDFLSIAQSYPGALAVNISVLIGYRICGVFGALICMIGAILPAFLVVLLISYFYFQNKSIKILDSFFYGLGPVVISLLVYSFYGMYKQIPKSRQNVLLLCASFVLVGIFKINPIYLILAGGVISICLK